MEKAIWSTTAFTGWRNERARSKEKTKKIDRNWNSFWLQRSDERKKMDAQWRFLWFDLSLMTMTMCELREGVDSANDWRHPKHSLIIISHSLSLSSDYAAIQHVIFFSRVVSLPLSLIWLYLERWLSADRRNGCGMRFNCNSMRIKAHNVINVRIFYLLSLPTEKINLKIMADDVLIDQPLINGNISAFTIFIQKNKYENSRFRINQNLNEKRQRESSDCGSHKTEIILSDSRSLICRLWNRLIR